jgi:hypothetical protein
MIGNGDTNKIGRQVIVHWIRNCLEKAKVQTITTTWAKIEIEIPITDV